jgi:creatinine amidohydrolase
MRLQHLTWLEAERQLARSPGILMPIGSTEQHGPNGLIGTDALTAEAIAVAAGDAADILVGPTIHVGMAQHHMGFVGSMTLRPATMIAVVRDHVMSLVHHGFTRFLFVNGHGGNVATLSAAYAEIYAEVRERHGAGGPDVRCQTLNWYEAGTVGQVARDLFGSADGRHATASEVSVTQHILPETIKRVPMDPPVAPTGGFYDWRHYRRTFPDGRIGSNPALATPEAGRRLFEAAVDGVARGFATFARAD